MFGHEPSESYGERKESIQGSWTHNALVKLLPRITHSKSDRPSRTHLGIVLSA
jgi:hypothetical protein